MTLCSRCGRFVACECGHNPDHSCAIAIVWTVALVSLLWHVVNWQKGYVPAMWEKSTSPVAVEAHEEAAP